MNSSQFIFLGSCKIRKFFVKLNKIFIKERDENAYRFFKSEASANTPLYGGKGQENSMIAITMFTKGKKPTINGQKNTF